MTEEYSNTYNAWQSTIAPLATRNMHPQERASDATKLYV